MVHLKRAQFAPIFTARINGKYQRHPNFCQLIGQLDASGSAHLQKPDLPDSLHRERARKLFQQQGFSTFQLSGTPFAILPPLMLIRQTPIDRSPGEPSFLSRTEK